MNEFRTYNLLTIKEAAKTINNLRKRFDFKVGLCQGCYDLLHPGHIKHLEAASKLCDVLIVAVNDDKTVNERKGNGRPIIPAKMSAYAISCLCWVSYVVITPYKRASPLIKILKPDYYIKGSDYKNQNTPGIIEEREAIKSVGGKMKYTNTPKYSTTDIIKHIQEKVRKKKVLLLVDRDGTLIEHVPWLGKDKNWKKQVKLKKKVVDYIYYLQKKFEVTTFVITNQGGVARGLFSTKTVEAINNYVNELLKKNNIKVDSWQYCPEADLAFAEKHPEIKWNAKYVKGVTYRKPNVRMVYLGFAQTKTNSMDFEKIIVLGDSDDDKEMKEALAVEKAKYIDVNKGGLKQWMKDLEN